MRTVARSSRRLLLQSANHLAGLVRSARLRQHVTSERHGLAVFTGKACGILQRFKGESRLPHLRVGLPQLEVPDPERGVEFERAPGQFPCRLVVARLESHLGRQCEADRLERLGFPGSLPLPPRFGDAAALRQRVPKLAKGRRRAGIQAGRGPEGRFGRRPVPFEQPLHVTIRQLRFGQIGVGGDGMGRGVPRPRTASRGEASPLMVLPAMVNARFDHASA